MNIVKVMGGLGNQMFQYAFARTINAKLDLSFYSSPDNETEIIPRREFLLDKFNCHYELAGDTQIARIVNDSEYDKNKIYKYAYFDGYWQKPSLFESIRYELCNELTLKDEYITNNMRYVISQMEKTNSVAIHVRRSDYVTLGFNLDIEYYKDAMRSIIADVENPQFFVFSDDIDWCKKNLPIRDKMYVHFGDYQDLYVMTNAKHMIMSNSTYSFWAYYLNRYIKSVVIPKDWNNVPSMFDERGEMI